MNITNIICDIFTSTNVFAWCGALCGHILSLYSDDFQGTQPFLKKMFPEKSNEFYVRVDFIVLPIIGALLSNVCLEPNNIKTAIFAGLTWSGSIITLLNNKKNK